MSSLEFDVLHALAIKGMAQPAALAVTAARDRDEVSRELERLRGDGSVAFLQRRATWRLSPDGRARFDELLEQDTPHAASDRLYPAYDRFLPLNLRLKEACTRWQTRGGAPNDHTDPGYDQAVIAELGELHAQTAPVLVDLAGVRVRFARYARRLAGALSRVRAGELDAFTGVLRDSYHDIWMELHRDLLLSLRTDRAAEQARQTSAGAGL